MQSSPCAKDWGYRPSLRQYIETEPKPGNSTGRICSKPILASISVARWEAVPIMSLLFNSAILATTEFDSMKFCGKACPTDFKADSSVLRMDEMGSEACRERGCQYG